MQRIKLTLQDKHEGDLVSFVGSLDTEELVIVATGFVDPQSFGDFLIRLGNDLGGSAHRALVEADLSTPETPAPEIGPHGVPKAGLGKFSPQGAALMAQLEAERRPGETVRDVERRKLAELKEEQAWRGQDMPEPLPNDIDDTPLERWLPGYGVSEEPNDSAARRPKPRPFNPQPRGGR